jgi:hypothetical protein
MKGNVRIFAYDVNSKIQNSPKVSLEQQFGKMAGSVLNSTAVLRLNFCAKLNISICWLFIEATRMQSNYK